MTPPAARSFSSGLPLALAPATLVTGSPCWGKTKLVKHLPTILPRLTAAGSLETTRIDSVAGELNAGVLVLATRAARRRSSRARLGG